MTKGAKECSKFRKNCITVCVSWVCMSWVRCHDFERHQDTRHPDTQTVIHRERTMQNKLLHMCFAHIDFYFQLSSLLQAGLGVLPGQDYSLILLGCDPPG